MFGKIISKNSSGKGSITFLSSLGAGLEYYDFIIYGMMASYLSPLFFPLDGELAGMLKTFSIFTVGYLARPLGGVIFGVLADKWGRQKMFSTIMLLMSFATLAIGLLPTAQTWGNASAVLLCLFRVLQGISFGAEIPGALTVVSEHHTSKSTGFHTSFVISSATCGALLASIILALLTHICSKEDILAGWWRGPFLAGGILMIIAYVVRAKVKETPSFQNSQFKHQGGFFAPLKLLLRDYSLQVLLMLMIKLFPAALIMTHIYYPSDSRLFLKIDSTDIFNAMTIGLVFSVAMTPILGFLTDRIDRVKLLLLGLPLFAGMGFLSLSLLSCNQFWCLCLFFIIHQFFISLSMMCTLPLMVKVFPTPVRFTGIALCYNMSYLLASFFPVIYLALIEHYKTPFIVFYVLLATACLSFLGAIILFLNAKRLLVE